MKRIFYVVICGFFLTGCASSYLESEQSGRVNFVQLNKDMFEIRALGSAYDRADMIRDYALLKASGLCRQKGFTHFLPITQDDSADISAEDPFYVTNCYGHSCYSSTVGPMVRTKPKSIMTVKMYGAGDELPSAAYACDMIYAHLAPKYMTSPE